MKINTHTHTGSSYLYALHANSSVMHFIIVVQFSFFFSSVQNKNQLLSTRKIVIEMNKKQMVYRADSKQKVISYNMYIGN